MKATDSMGKVNNVLSTNKFSLIRRSSLKMDLERAMKRKILFVTPTLFGPKNEKRVVKCIERLHQKFEVELLGPDYKGKIWGALMNLRGII